MSFTLSFKSCCIIELKHFKELTQKILKNVKEGSNAISDLLTQKDGNFLQDYFLLIIL